MFRRSDQVSDGNRIHGSRFSGDAFTQQPLSAAVLAGVDEAIIRRNASQSFKESSLAGKYISIFDDQVLE